MAGSSSLAHLEPAVIDWLTEERLQALSADFGSTSEFLALAGLRTKALEYWLRLQVAREAALSETLWPAMEREQELDQLEAAWRNNNDPAAFGLSDDQVRLKLMVRPGCTRWARFHWSYRIESLFLDRKSTLDQASCRLLRISDKHLAQEIYYRALAKEDSFTNLANQFGEGNERFQGGFLPLQPISSMPMGLGKLLNRLVPLELSRPLKLGDGFALVLLEQLVPATLCPKTEEILLNQEFVQWLAVMQPHLARHLIS